jgi:hypothetical protein
LSLPLALSVGIVAAPPQNTLHGRNRPLVVAGQSGSTAGQTASFLRAAIDIIGGIDALRFFEPFQEISRGDRNRAVAING